jgi:hypothetical protein
MLATITENGAVTWGDILIILAIIALLVIISGRFWPRNRP